MLALALRRKPYAPLYDYAPADDTAEEHARQRYLKRTESHEKCPRILSGQVGDMVLGSRSIKSQPAASPPGTYIIHIYQSAWLGFSNAAL